MIGLQNNLRKRIVFGHEVERGGSAVTPSDLRRAFLDRAQELQPRVPSMIETNQRAHRSLAQCRELTDILNGDADPITDEHIIRYVSDSDQAAIASAASLGRAVARHRDVGLVFWLAVDGILYGSSPALISGDRTLHPSGNIGIVDDDTKNFG